MSPAFPHLLATHNILRWIVLIAAVLSVLVALTGLIGGRRFQPLGRKVSAIFTGLMDLQFLFGLGLYFMSPVVKGAMANMKAAMKDKEMRFFAVEHITIMILALAFVHIGTAVAKKAINDKTAYKKLLIWHALALIAMLAGMPWFRPMFRAFGS